MSIRPWSRSITVIWRRASSPTLSAPARLASREHLIRPLCPCTKPLAHRKRLKLLGEISKRREEGSSCFRRRVDEVPSEEGDNSGARVASGWRVVPGGRELRDHLVEAGQIIEI